MSIASTSSATPTSSDGVMTGVGNGSLIVSQLAIAFIPITILSVSLRMYVRAAVVKSLGWDDFMLLVAQAFFLVFCSYAYKVVQMEHGTVSVTDASGVEKMLEVLETASLYADYFVMFYCFSVVMLKVSLAIFFLRIVVAGWQRAVIYTATGIISSYGLAYGLIFTFRCGSPYHQIKAQMEGECLSDMSMLLMTVVFGVLDAVTDWTFAILPVVVLWKANMPRSMKISSCILLSIGSVSCICALIRLAALSNLKNDYMEAAIDTGIMSILEPGIGISVVSLAACRPLWRKIFEESEWGSIMKQVVMFKRGSRTGSSRSDGVKLSSNYPRLGFVERSDGLEGFKRFNSPEYGLTTTVVTADTSKRNASTELHDLESLEAQSDYVPEDKSERWLVRTSLTPENPWREGIKQTRDVSVDVTDDSRHPSLESNA